MAGMPESIITRSKQILIELESERRSPENSKSITIPSQKLQVHLIENANPEEAKIIQEIENIDPQTMSPVECLMKLMDFKKRLKK